MGQRVGISASQRHLGTQSGGGTHLVAVTSGNPHAGFDFTRRGSPHFLSPLMIGTSHGPIQLPGAGSHGSGWGAPFLYQKMKGAPGT